MTDEQVEQARMVEEMRRELEQVKELKWMGKCVCCVLLCYAGVIWMARTGAAFGDVLILVGVVGIWRLCKKGF